jgi:hypothetical protein
VPDGDRKIALFNQRYASSYTTLASILSGKYVEFS